MLGMTRIGVHAGPAIVGTFGGGRFFDYTAYGDTINTAARLELVSKQLGTRICVSQSIAERIRDFKGRPVGDLGLRGKSGPLRAFEPRPQKAISDPTTALYLAAFAKLEGGDSGAISAFATLVGLRSRRLPRQLPLEAATERRFRGTNSDGLAALSTLARPSFRRGEGARESCCPRRQIMLVRLQRGRGEIPKGIVSRRAAGSPTATRHQIGDPLPRRIRQQTTACHPSAPNSSIRRQIESTPRRVENS